MLHHQDGVRLDETQRENRIREQLVKVLGRVGGCHADVVGLQMTVHGEREQHDIEEATFDQ